VSLHCYSAVDPVPDLDSIRQDQLLDENLGLRAHIKHLETLLTEKEPSISTISSRTSKTFQSSQPPEDIVTTFEGLHLGVQADETPQGSNINSVISHGDIISLLPIRESSLKLVRFSLGTLGWVHCALNAPRFLAEHDAFWSSLELNDIKVLDNHGWMSVYLSVLAVSPFLT
jgi:hypothetical protein